MGGDVGFDAVVEVAAANLKFVQVTQDVDGLDFESAPHRVIVLRRDLPKTVVELQLLDGSVELLLAFRQFQQQQPRSSCPPPGVPAGQDGVADGDQENAEQSHAGGGNEDRRHQDSKSSRSRRRRSS